jgi:hypothetical protein
LGKPFRRCKMLTINRIKCIFPFKAAEMQSFYVIDYVSNVCIILLMEKFYSKYSKQFSWKILLIDVVSWHLHPVIYCVELNLCDNPIYSCMASSDRNGWGTEFRDALPVTYTAYRDGAFMLTVLTMLARLTLWKTKNKSLLSYFCGSVVHHTLEHSRTDEIKCIVSQLQSARRR